MATLAAGAIQTTFAATSFSGDGFLFSKLINHSGSEAEMKRHNLSLEKNLAEAKEKFYEQQVIRQNKIRELERQLSNANTDINQTNY